MNKEKLEEKPLCHYVTSPLNKGSNIRPMKDSGIQWIGQIPEEWNTQHVKTIFDLRTEKSFLPLSEVNLISLYTDKGVIQHSDLEETSGNKASNAEGYKIVHKNDIVVNIILCWMGAIGRSDYDGVTSPAYDVYSPKTGVESKYYHYYFRTKGFNGDCYKNGRGIMLMRWRTYSDQFRAITVPVPPLTEQQAIANFLDKKCSAIDSVLEKTKASIEEYKKLKQSVITQAVTKGIRPNRQMKNSGIEWIGQIPEDWETIKIKYTSWLKGRIGWDGLKSTEFIEEGPYLITGVDFKDGCIDWSNCYHISKERFEEDKALHIKENDLLITKDGTVGKLAIVKKCPEEVSLNSGVLLIRNTKPFKYNTNYLYYVLYSDEFNLWYLLSQNGNSTIKHLYQEQFYNFEYTYPPLAEQQTIVDYLDTKCTEIDNLIAKKEQFLKEIESYKKSLIYEYVTGKRRVEN